MILLDMNMPKSCNRCSIHCQVTKNDSVLWHDRRKDDCPIKVEIPDNATNADVIKALFPNIQFEDSWDIAGCGIVRSFHEAVFYKKWWNAPYCGTKMRSEDEE